MAAFSESRVSIRFFGDELDPGELTRVLGCEPTLQYKKGDARPSAGASFRWRWGGWVLAADDRLPEAVDEQLGQLFAKMTQDLAVWKNLASRTKADVFCGLFMAESNEGFSLSPNTLAAVAARGLSIGFDVYSHNELNQPSSEQGEA